MTNTITEVGDGLAIDSEFKALIPPLSPEEYELLKASILAEGVRDPLVVWNAEKAMFPDEHKAADEGGTVYCKYCYEDREVEYGDGNIECEACNHGLAPTGPDIIVDGHNRFEISWENNISHETVELDADTRDDVILWIIQNQLGRRNLHAVDKVPLAERRRVMLEAQARERQANSTGGPQPQLRKNFTEADSARTNDKLAESIGVSRPTYEALKTVHEKGTPELKDAVRQNRIGASTAKVIAELPEEKQAEVLRADDKKGVRAVLGDIKRKESREADHRALEQARQSISEDKARAIESVCDLRHCSCRELFASGIKPDAVITDPPYPKEFLPVFSELAEACKECGVPLVAVMSGQSYLPDVIGRLCQHLAYRWTLAYLTPGGQAVQQWQAKVNTAWKPVLLFGEAKDWFGDVATSKPNDNDKRFHGWGQSESGMADLVERLTEPGQLVCDPFLGGGTTAVVSLALSRRFVGCDVDAECIKKTQLRVEACNV